MKQFKKVLGIVMISMLLILGFSGVVKTKAGVENLKKVIYLTQKWATKFGNNPSFSIFRDNFNFLKGKQNITHIYS